LSIKKREKEEEKVLKKRKKAPRVSSNKRGSQYFERRKTLQLQKFFLYDSIFSPSIIPFRKCFPNH
jgi:hypothetical protein